MVEFLVKRHWKRRVFRCFVQAAPQDNETSLCVHAFKLEEPLCLPCIPRKSGFPRKTGGLPHDRKELNTPCRPL